MTDPVVASKIDFLPIRWTLEKAGAPLYLRSRETFRITVSDDLTGLDVFEALLQGVYL